jgi:RNA polymerase sigma factor (sigma-70 family)
LFEAGAVGALTDGQLLERFAARRDLAAEAAFTVLVERHGPMVLGVCRQLLHDRHHAEDAFQAVFLVLARKAGAIRDPERLGNWLYGVALRTAAKARRRLDRRRRSEVEAGTSSVEPAIEPGRDPGLLREEAEAVHQELGGLPARYRAPVVLCYLEGLTHDQAARRLRCPVGTVRSRLARARERLRDGLTRRGVTLSSAWLGDGPPPLPAGLPSATARAAARFAAVDPPSAATVLARAVLRSMAAARLGRLALVLLAPAALAIGALVRPRSERAPAPGRIATIGGPARPGREAEDARSIVIAGRVLDPAGHPLAGAELVLLARAKGAGSDGYRRKDPAAAGTAVSDRQGQYRLAVPRISASRHEEVVVAAGAPGFGIGWAGLDPDARRVTADIRLPAERVLRGRLVDPHGRPVAGAEVTVISMGQVVDGRVRGLLADWADPRPMPLRPGPTVTDAEGRFILRGIGQGLGAVLAVDDRRFARLRYQADPGDPPAKEHVLALEPARIIAGRVVCTDTGQGVPHALLTVSATQERFGVPSTSTFRADDRGRFRINPTSGNHYQIVAHPAPGSPYLLAVAVLAWPEGSIEQAVDLRLRRGAMLRGTVAEAGSGAPIEGASLEFLPSRSGGGDEATVRYDVANSRPDGTFRIAIPPRPGHLVVRGPSDDYVLRMIAGGRILDGRGGGHRVFAHGIVPVDPRNDDGRGCTISLRRGVMVEGTVLGPDGQPVAEARFATTALLPPMARGWVGGFQGTMRDGRFVLHGLNPEETARVLFLDSGRRWGGATELSGRSGDVGPVAVRLRPCGKAAMRLVDPGGAPVQDYAMDGSVAILAAPGLPSRCRPEPGDERLLADEVALVAFDRDSHRDGLTSDARGRLTLPGLIPGVTYRIYDDSTVNGPAGIQLRREFTVDAAAALDLGDILIERPAHHDR